MMQHETERRNQIMMDQINPYTYIRNCWYVAGLSKEFEPGKLTVCGVPAFETFLSMMRRHIAGMPYFSGDSSHMHHVLMTHKKLTVRKTVTVLAFVQVLFSAIAVLSRVGLGWHSLIPASALPRAAIAKSRWLETAFVPEGGHAGFLEGPSGARSWAEARAVEFLKRHLLG